MLSLQQLGVDSIHGYLVSLFFIDLLLEYYNIYSQISEIYIQEYVYLEGLQRTSF